MIVLARVDSRLIHGQVLEGWIPFTKTTMVIVADNRVAANPLQKRLMSMAIPSEIKLKVESIDEAVADIKNEGSVSERVMIIFSSPHDAVEACHKGMGCTSINLGNVNYVKGRRQVTPSIALDDHDVEDLRELIREGVRIDVRGVPQEKPSDIEELIDGYYRVCRT